MEIAEALISIWLGIMLRIQKDLKMIIGCFVEVCKRRGFYGNKTVVWREREKER